MKTIIKTFITSFIIWYLMCYFIGWFVGQDPSWPISSEFNRITTVLLIIAGIVIGIGGVTLIPEIKKELNKIKYNN